MQETVDIKVTRMETELNHIKEDVFEIKTEQKLFHEKTDEKIDNIAIKLQEFGGLTQMVSTIQIQANKNSEWISENKQFIQELKEERKDTRQRIRDFVFKWGFTLLMFVIALYLFITSTITNNALSKTLKEGVVIKNTEL